MATILVVDDHAPMVEHITRLLSDAGHRVEFLLEASYLMQKLENDSVDLILLDIYMPDLDGITLLKTIRANAESREIPVIMITGEADDHLVQECFQLGAVDFLNKPIHRLELISRIETALQTRQYIQDIEAQKESLSQAKEFVETVINSMEDVICVMDSHAMEILEVNRAFCTFEGVEREQVVGQACYQPREGRHHPCYDCPVENAQGLADCRLRDTFVRGATMVRRILFYQGDGSPVHVHTTATAVRDGRGVIRQVVYHARNDSECYLLEERLRYHASHDSLTGLPNRHLFLEILGQALIHGQKKHSQGAILYLDMDRFKDVNRAMGRKIADMVLGETGRRLVARAGKEHTVARLEGDKFLVLLPTVTGVEEATAMARALLAQVNAPMLLGEEKHVFSAGLGISLFPAHGWEPEGLLRKAELALQQAKTMGAGQWGLYDGKENAEV